MARALAATATIFLVIYLPAIGRGFISDDFRWIVENRIGSTDDLAALFSANIGFYRPLTSLSFAADHAAWGTHPLGYGVTNLILCLAAAAALFAVARRLGLPAGPALLASGAWLLNFHAVNMAVLWLSGRTALLASAFSLATAYAVLDGRHLVAGILALLAMLSKEEAVVLPVLLTVFQWAEARRAGTGPAEAGFYVEGFEAGPAEAGLYVEDVGAGPAEAGLYVEDVGAGPVKAGLHMETGANVESGFSRTMPLWTALLVYLLLRWQSGAFWPANAPDYYQFSWSPAVIGRNILEYADRAGTVFAFVAVVFVAAGRLRWADVSPPERRVLIFAATWIAAMYALTVFLPVRSSLYALLPSIGSALAVGAIGAAAARRNPARVRTAALALVVVATLLIPVYRSRNARWVGLAALSASVMQTIASDARGRSSGHVVLIDAPQERFNLASAFGNLLPEALQLHVGAGWTGEIVPPASAGTRPGDLEYRLMNGSLQRASQ